MTVYAFLMTLIVGIGIGSIGTFTYLIASEMRREEKLKEQALGLDVPDFMKIPHSGPILVHPSQR